MTRRDFIKTAGTFLTIGSISRTLTGCGDSTTSSAYTEKTPVYLMGVASTGGSYDDYGCISHSIREMVEYLYGVRPFFSRGDTLSIKVNIVGTATCCDRSAALTYVTHPDAVRALGEAFFDLGAGRISIIEGSTHPSETMTAFSDLGYDEIAQYLGAELLDLNRPDPYEGFCDVSIDDGLAYEGVSIHRHLCETDCVITASKLKCHSMAGISLSLKNLIGVLPVQVYGVGGTGPRTPAVHAPDPTTRIPYNVIDLGRLLPIGFAFIDGISAIDRGEGPWVSDVSFVEPGVFLASTDPVAVDTIGCRVMGFDPTTPYPGSPFVNCLNHLDLAARYDIGTNDESRITIIGDSVDSALLRFEPPV